MIAASDPQSRVTTFMIVVHNWSDGAPCRIGKARPLYVVMATRGNQIAPSFGVNPRR